IAACCRDAPALVTDALQFLNQVGPDAAFSKRLAYFHVDVAVGPIVMAQNIPRCGNDTADRRQPFRLWIQLLLSDLLGILRGCSPKEGVGERVGRCHLVMKENRLAGYGGA